MKTNDVLRQLRYAMKLADNTLLDLMNQSGAHIDLHLCRAYLKKEEEVGFAECPPAVLSAFLDTFIEWKRGPKGLMQQAEDEDEADDEDEAAEALTAPRLRDKGKKFANPNKRVEFSAYSNRRVILHKKSDLDVEKRESGPLTNNQILRKIRIALELKEEEMLRCFTLGGFSINRSQLSAFFRSRDHRNYRPAGDQAVRYFMRGLVKYYRG